MSVPLIFIVALGIILVLTLVAGLVLLILFISKQLSGGRGGWVRLIEHYGTSRAPAGTVLAKQTVQIGSVLYRNCTTLGIADEGLYITTWKKTVLIPWGDFAGISQGRLYWERELPCCRLVIRRLPRSWCRRNYFPSCVPICRLGFSSHDDHDLPAATLSCSWHMGYAAHRPGDLPMWSDPVRRSVHDVALLARFWACGWVLMMTSAARLRSK